MLRLQIYSELCNSLENRIIAITIAYEAFEKLVARIIAEPILARQLFRFNAIWGEKNETHIINCG